MDDLRVAVYLRCSTTEQATEGHSIEAQRRRVRAWCEASGAIIVHEVIDEGVSGTTPLGLRPGGARIVGLLDLRRPGVDAVVVASLDRLGRDAADVLTLVRRFSSGPIGLASVSDRLDLTTPQGRAMAGVAAVFSELERGLIAERTKQALAAKRDQGQQYGPLPYGWVSVDGYLVADPDEQDVLLRIRRLRSKGRSYRAIASRLNGDGVKPKRGTVWWPMTVRGVLMTSTTLAGIAALQEGRR